eukprot:PhF_6_TR38707/c1_g1_i1/m.57924
MAVNPLYVSFAVLLLVFGLIIFLMNRLKSGSFKDKDSDGETSETETNPEDAVATREQIGRVPGRHLSKKKAEKLQAKDERKRNHEAVIEQRRRQREQEEEATIQKELDAKAEEEKKKEERRLVQEEKKKKDDEEYKKWIGCIETEDKGEAAVELTEEDLRNQLQIFVAEIKEKKVVMLEELATNFKMPIDRVVASIHSLEKRGDISGVFDDRGKYIYITKAEYEGMARFMKQRGRVSTSELVAESSRLIKWEGKEN